MCCHRFYIYTRCGHSTFAPKPIVECLDATIPPDGSFSISCDITPHPYQSWRLDSLCPRCADVRRRLLERIEAMQAITFDEVKWKVSYGLDAHGKDVWGRKAEERERLEKETGKRKRKSGRWSWKRSKSRGKTEGEVNALAGRI